MTDKKTDKKQLTVDEKLAAIIAVLKANGMSLPKGLHDDEAAD